MPGLFADMLHSLVENGADVVVGQGIVDGFTISAIFDELGVF